jgi:hypothetical protein
LPVGRRDPDRVGLVPYVCGDRRAREYPKILVKSQRTTAGQAAGAKLQYITLIGIGEISGKSEAEFKAFHYFLVGDVAHHERRRIREIFDGDLYRRLSRKPCAVERPVLELVPVLIATVVPVEECAVAAQQECAVLDVPGQDSRQPVTFEVEVVLENAARGRIEQNRNQYGVPGDGRTTLQTSPYCTQNAIPCSVVVLAGCVQRIVADHRDRQKT